MEKELAIDYLSRSSPLGRRLRRAAKQRQAGKGRPQGEDEMALRNSEKRGVAKAMLIALCALAAGAAGAQDRKSPPVQVDPDGTIHAPAMSVPVSSLLSPEGKAYMAEHLRQMQQPALLAQKDGVPVFMEPYLARQRALFPHDRTDTKIGGVHVYDYAPKGGVAPENRNRVLINLHGGGFMGCFQGCGELESLPLTSLGRIRVVAVDYRQGPEHRFPAASEDVAAVYRELLKTYPAQNIGIYGCSAGGMLTGMSVAWFQTHGLPRPGAIGIFCAGATLSSSGFGGDADFFTGPLGDARPPAPWPPTRPASDKSGMPYLAGASIKDPMVSPTASDAVLSQFPPRGASS
jgi:acetyl esterase/lipase